MLRDVDLIYCSGQDMFYLSLFSSLGFDIPLVAEIGDLTPLQTSSSFRSRLFRYIDKFLSSKASLLIVISEGFVISTTVSGLNSRPILVLPNKIFESDFSSVNSNSSSLSIPLVSSSSIIRIGYFGLLRDNWSLSVLLNLAKQYPSKFEIILAGLPQLNYDLMPLIQDSTNIHFVGEYKSPLDLPYLYSSIDIVWACYPPIDVDNWNLRWGRPNRFYESCYFGLPCIARDGSLFANDVKSLSIGYVINDSDVASVVQELSSLSKVQINKFSDSVSCLPSSFFTMVMR